MSLAARGRTEQSMRDHDLLHGRGRTALVVASVTCSIAVTVALGVSAAEASSRQSAKTIFAAARARLINESQLAGHWTASSYGAGSSGGGSGSSGGSGTRSSSRSAATSASQASTKTRTSSKVTTSIGRGPMRRSRKRSTSTPILSRPPRTSGSPPPRLSNPVI